MNTMRLSLRRTRRLTTVCFSSRHNVPYSSGQGLSSRVRRKRSQLRPSLPRGLGRCPFYGLSSARNQRRSIVIVAEIQFRRRKRESGACVLAAGRSAIAIMMEWCLTATARHRSLNGFVSNKVHFIVCSEEIYAWAGACLFNATPFCCAYNDRRCHRSCRSIPDIRTNLCLMFKKIR